MTDRETLITLAAKIEAAEEPDREMFEEAFNACRPEPPKGNPLAPMWQWEVWSDYLARLQQLLSIEAYEQAAMILVPEGWAWCVFSPDYDEGRLGYSAELAPNHDLFKKGASAQFSDAPTPAQALAAAALRAVAEGEE